MPIGQLGPARRLRVDQDQRFPPVAASITERSYPRFRGHGTCSSFPTTVWVSRIARSGAYQPERSYLARCRADTHAHVHATAPRSFPPRFFFSPRFPRLLPIANDPRDHRRWRNLKEKSKSIQDRPRKRPIAHFLRVAAPIANRTVSVPLLYEGKWKGGGPVTKFMHNVGIAKREVCFFSRVSRNFGTLYPVLGKLKLSAVEFWLLFGFSDILTFRFCIVTHKFVQKNLFNWLV